jgi:hypothetical protein
MAKKTRKVLKQASSQRAIRQAMSNVQAVSVVETSASAPASAPVARTPLNAAARPAKVEIDPREEYKYVRTDLRRIGILAASFTAILIVLSFFIH